ncbi:MAG: hypothetical protein A4E58_01080 [Syntrophorhabdus sp. PtaB.Bin006]|nr:MAG: hypothetical protein A4E58_01080 [Syntrophorhabdus sp. PtaB.Bin006]
MRHRNSTQTQLFDRCRLFDLNLPKPHHRTALRRNSREVGPDTIIEKIICDDIEYPVCTDQLHAVFSHHDKLIDKGEEALQVIDMGMAYHDVPYQFQSLIIEHLRYGACI